MSLFLAISFNSFSDRFSILIHEHNFFFVNMYLLLALSCGKLNDVVRERYGYIYILLPNCANILLDYLFWLLLGWLFLICFKLYKVITAIIKLHNKTPLR